MKLNFNKRPLSYSCLNSFEYNKETWYRTYILNQRQQSREMDFGKMIDERFQNDLSFIPEIPRYPLLQHEMKATFDSIPLIGKPDNLYLDKFLLRDLKTGKWDWTTEKADNTKQFDMYLLLIYLVYKIKPDKFTCFIDWLPTRDSGNFEISFIEPVKVQSFKTKRTMGDILRYGAYIKNTIKLMQEFVDNYPIA